jgi:hypothetical protein
VRGIASTRCSRLAMPRFRIIKPTTCVLTLFLLTAGLSGCGQVMERIQGRSGEKPSPTAASSPTKVKSTAPNLPTKESVGQAPSPRPAPGTGAPSTPMPTPTPSPSPSATPLPSPSAAPGPTAPQASGSPTAELHQAPQEAPSATRIYRSSDARRP